MSLGLASLVSSSLCLVSRSIELIETIVSGDRGDYFPVASGWAAQTKGGVDPMPPGAAYWWPTKTSWDGSLHPGYEEPAARTRRGTPSFLLFLHFQFLFSFSYSFRFVWFVLMYRFFCLRRIRSDCEKRPQTMLSSLCRRNSLPLNCGKRKRLWPSKNCDRKSPSWAPSGLGTCRLIFWSYLDNFFNGIYSLTNILLAE